MPPPVNRAELARQLTEKFSITDQQQRKRELTDTIRANTTGRATVDRAKVASEVLHNREQRFEVSHVSREIIDKELSDLRETQRLENESLELAGADQTAAIETRLNNLQTEITYYTEARTAVLANIAAATPAPGSRNTPTNNPNQPVGFGQTMNNMAEVVGNAFTFGNGSPTVNRSIGYITGGALALGIGYGLFKWMRGSASEGKEAAEKTKGSSWWKWLVGGTVAIGGLVGLNYALKHFAGIDAAKAAAARANALAARLQSQVENMRRENAPWEQYGLTETQYNNAEEIFRRTNGEEEGEEEINNYLQSR